MKKNKEQLSKNKNDSEVSFTQDQTTKSNIIVSVRCRPLTPKELEFSNIETVRCKDKKQVTVLDPIEYDGPEDIFKGRSREQQYAFDHVFNQVTSQEEVYKNTAEVLIQGVIEGYNATVFAYGASGAGKTFTMLGNGDSVENAGVMPRSLSDLFKVIDKTKSSSNEFRLKLSYIEIYNETIRDLLSESDKNLILREDPNIGCQVVNLNEIFVTTATDVFKLLTKGNLNRTTEATNHNETSSRSHGILQINVESKDRSDNLDPKTVVGKFVLVDLAGSERSSSTKNTGLRLIEGGNINKSLLALGNCINGLVESSEKGVKIFIPWRDSKLTRILKDSLGGNSRISMIANISPSIKCIEDTLNTLKYANRAKNIKITIKQNVQEVGYHIEKYDDIIKKLKDEIEDLKDKLNKQIVLPRIGGENVEQIAIVEEVQAEINKHFQKEVQLRKSILQAEESTNNINYKISEMEYELFLIDSDKTKDNRSKDLKDLIQKANNELEVANNKLAERYKVQDTLMNNRKEIQIKISNLSKDPLGKNLIVSYKYYCSLLENMNLEEKKNNNINNIKIKDFAIDKLTNQINIRDQLIHQAIDELKKKNEKFKINDNIKKVEEIKSNAYKLLPLINSHSKGYRSQAIENNFVSNNNNKEINPYTRKHRPISMNRDENQNNQQNHPANHYHNNNNNNNNKQINHPNKFKSNPIDTQSSLDYSSYRHANINKEPRKFKTKTTDVRDQMKNQNVSNLKLNMINNNYPNSKVYFSNGKGGGGDNSVEGISFDINNIQTNEALNSSNNDSANNSMLERGLDKKTKHILKFAGNNRARSNPYLR